MKIPIEKMAADARLMMLATSKACDALRDARLEMEARDMEAKMGAMSVRMLATLYHFITTN